MHEPLINKPKRPRASATIRHVALMMAGEKGKKMKIREIIDKENGKRWDIYKKDENKYFYKYYEFFKSFGWRLLGQDGGHKQGFYWSKEAIEYEFDIKVI